MSNLKEAKILAAVAIVLLELEDFQGKPDLSVLSTT
jgi:hypothetical protein